MNRFAYIGGILLWTVVSLFSSISTAETSRGWVKCPDNPVLGGDLGVCFDISMIQTRLDDGIVYKMWFSWRTKKSIAYTESRDGIHWNAPKIVLSPAGNWEQDLNRPGVVFKDGTYHLWYTGQALGQSRIGYATSPDGLSWTRVQNEPVLVSEQAWEKVAVMCPHVLWDEPEKVYKMWYSAGEQYEPNAIGYATSSDGIHWAKRKSNPIFVANPETDWEKHKVTAAQVFIHNGWYYMFYIGFANENLARIGIARSRDGVTNWERLPGNPIISPDAQKWDADACYKPFVLYDETNDCWRLWYNGRRGHVEQIGMAIHKGGDFGFPKPSGSSSDLSSDLSSDSLSDDGFVLKADDYRFYVDQFNADDEETIRQLYPNSAAWDFLKANIPLLDYPDKALERVWYFRWWTFRKHIKRGADGTFVVTEFLPPVPWAGKENAISCPAGHHFREARWLQNETILRDYARFWLLKGGALRSYSFWPADSLWQQALVTGDTRLIKELLPELVRNYEAWEAAKRDPNGLFWQNDGNDGMEVSIGGSGYRATINTYMYMEATAIARVAALLANETRERRAESTGAANGESNGESNGSAGTLDPVKIQTEFQAKADCLKRLINERLWDKTDSFYKVAQRVENQNNPLSLQKVREEHGYTPWYADEGAIPPVEYNVAWKQLTDPQGFFAPFGPTTAEQRNPGFKIEYANHECQWNGPSWPYSTSITETALANLINREAKAGRNVEELKDAFRKTLDCYVRSHKRVREDGKTISWIDENINPFNGDWISRARLIEWNWSAAKGGYERGKDYNHSTFCDLIVNGLIGVRPQLGNELELFPLVDRAIPYFCLDNLPYHRRRVTILYDATGERYHRGTGFRVFIDGKEALTLAEIPDRPVRVKLPE